MHTLCRVGFLTHQQWLTIDNLTLDSYTACIGGLENPPYITSLKRRVLCK